MYQISRPYRFADAMRAREVLRRSAYFERRRRQRRGSQSTQDPLSLDVIADHENLIRAYYRARSHGGWAPGSDSLTYDMLGKSEVADIMRRISAYLRLGQYQPQPLRRVQIPKANGGHRTLDLLSIPDRAVATAVAEPLAIAIDPGLSPYTFGFRTGRGTHAMLASLHREITEHGHSVIAQDDVRDAFPSIRVPDAMSDLASIIYDPRTLRLVEALVRPNESEEVGTSQGSPLSPLVLSHHVNTRLGAHRGDPGTPPLHIYADNLVVACSDATVGQALINEAGQRLSQVGLTLKRNSPTVDIRQPGAWADVLGIRISIRRGEIRYAD